MLFLGTIWPDNLTTREARPGAEEQSATSRGDIGKLLAETKADRVQVADALTADELKAASDDRRIQTAHRESSIYPATDAPTPLQPHL